MVPQDALPQQLVVQVLRHMHVKDRLKCALVCTAWRESAAQATSDISITCRSGGGCQRRCAALTSWLLNHGQAAAVESIAVAGEDSTTVSYQHPLVLPLQHVRALRKLHAHMFAVAAMPSAEAAAAAAQATTHRGLPPVPPPTLHLPTELSALTYLGLSYSFMQLTALPTFTRLERLELDESVYGSGAPFSYNSRDNVAALEQALPQLECLTGLKLGFRYTSNAVVATLHHLSCLQDLELVSSNCTEAAFAAGALPATLTRLIFAGIVGTNDRTLSPANTPALTQLTALQSLSVASVRVFDAALVQPLTRLTHLYVLNCHCPPSGLAALSSLLQMRCLQLSASAPPDAPPGSTADVAALTASSQLTRLGIGAGLVRHDQYIHLFPAGRRLPHLQQLCATRGLLSRVFNIDRLVQSCPELRSLRLESTDATEPGAGTAEDDCGFEMHSWASLLGLSKLTSLRLNLNGMKAAQIDWCWIGSLESLESLDIGQIGWGLIGGILSLTRCRKLTLLRLRFQTSLDLFHLDGGRSTQLELKNQAPEGLPPDVWCQLPYAVLTAAQQRLNEYSPLDALEEPVDEVLKAVMHEATSYLWVLNEQHRKQQQELSSQMLAMQAQLAEQQEQWQQEVAGLRGSLAAMAAQLAAMQQQLLQQQLGR